MGPGQWHWVRQLGRPSRSDHAAGDGEPVRRHGQRAAGHADERTYAGHANDRYEPADYDDHVTVSGCHLLGRYGRHYQRDCDRRRRRRGRRGRGIHRRQHLAPGDDDVGGRHLRHLELFVDRPRVPDYDDQCPGRR